MIRRTVCRPESGPETGRAPVAVRNRRQEGVGKTPRVDSVFLPRSLVAEECEQLVLDDRTAQNAAELVLIQDLLRCSAGPIVAVVEEGIGVKNRVSQIFKRRSMELIRSGFRNDVYIRAWIPPVAGVVGRGLNLELLEGVWAWYSDSGVQARIIGASTVGEIGDIDAIHLEVVLAGVVAIHRHVLRTLAEGCGVVGGRIGSRRQGQNLRVVASAQWKLSDGLGAYSGPQRGRGRLQSFRLDFDRHLLALRADFQSPVEYLCLGSAHRHR